MFFCFVFIILYCSSIISVKGLLNSSFTVAENFKYSDSEKAIFGNLIDMDEDTSNTIEQMLNDSKHVLLYDLSKKVVSYKSNEYNDDTVAIAYSKQNGVLYRRTYSSNETDSNNLLKDIESFFSNFVLDVMKQKEYEMQAKKNSINANGTTTNAMEASSTTGDFVRIEEASGESVLKPHGKIVYVTNVYISQPDSLYSIFIVETYTEFVPGYALRELGDTTYQNYISTKSRQITSISQVVRIYYGYSVYGEDPNVLEYWPKNTVVNRTISTSFGIGAQLGYSSKDGFTGSITGNFGYSQSYETTDPSMNATTLIIGEEYGWYFTFSNTSVRRKTLHFNSGQMVEMLNGSFNGQFTVDHEFWYRVDKFLGHTTEITYTPSFIVYPYDGQM